MHGGEGSVDVRPVVVKKGHGKRTAIVASDVSEPLGAADGEDFADEEPDSVDVRAVVGKKRRGKKTAIQSVASDEPEPLGADDGEDVADEEPAKQRCVVRVATRRPSATSDVPGTS